MAITDYEDKIKSIVDSCDTDTFIYEFLSVYDKISRATITKLRKGTNNLSKNIGEIHLKNKLFFKETSLNLIQEYSDLEDRVSTLKAKPRYIIVTDYQKLLAKDTTTNDTLDIEFKKLPKYFDFFLAWNGIEKADFDKENPADLKAAERFAKLFDSILKDNEEIDRHGLNLFLIRILFCLFAEDTGIFENGIFTNYVKTMTKEDGSDMNARIQELFSYLDKKERTDDVPGHLARFPYVNGQLFSEPHESVVMSKQTRKLIIDSGELISWEKVNPDILGSMLQAVATEDKRSHLGMHYTSVPNIMKVIKPLFLDDLRRSFEQAKGNESKLNELLTRIGNIKFMDPACGSGNFLIITYKELRKLEMDILEEIIRLSPTTMYVPTVSLRQFYGIEIEDFAVDVTRLSLWIADHQMNKELNERFHDVVRPTLPLQVAGDIYCGNALRIDWEEILPHEKDDEIYLFGNPPYLGAKKQSKPQKKDMEYILSNEAIRYKKLDYISGWFYLGAKYTDNTRASFAFVSTNSIVQGEHVGDLWPYLLNKVQISFAYQSFKWTNNAKNNAGVTVIVIGCVGKRIRFRNKKLFAPDNRWQIVKNISPYLTVGDNTIVHSISKPLYSGMPNCVFGSMPRDNQKLLLNFTEYSELLLELPKNISTNILRRYIGAKDFINQSTRYCLWITDDYIKNAEKNKFISARLEEVKEFRQRSKAKSTVSAATTPFAFVQRGEYLNAFKHVPFSELDEHYSIVIPRVSSENRLYVPIGLCKAKDIISDSAMAIYDAPIWLLGLLESRMHMVWLRNIGGKLKKDYRYSNTLVYNTFPVPGLSTRRKNEIEELVMDILDIREEEGGTLAELYGSPLAEKNPKPMNERLLQAHQRLDKVVDRAYKDRDFKDDNERLSLLLDMYSQRVNEEMRG